MRILRAGPICEAPERTERVRQGHPVGALDRDERLVGDACFHGDPTPRTEDRLGVAHPRMVAKRGDRRPYVAGEDYGPKRYLGHPTAGRDPTASTYRGRATIRAD